METFPKFGMSLFITRSPKCNTVLKFTTTFLATQSDVDLKERKTVSLGDFVMNAQEFMHIPIGG